MISAAACFALVAMTLTASGVEAWSDPAVNAENRLPARTFLPRDGYVLSLDGTWSFAWEGGSDGSIGTRAPSDSETPFTIDVPSCAETRGWGVPHYVNVKYPHPVTPPTIDPGYNPTMLYRRRFAVPAQWKGQNVILRFEGASSCCEIWVNGRRVGYFEDARLPSEFDITPFVEFGDGAGNLIEAKVRKWCDGSYVEDQDMIRYAGLFRSVKIYAERKDGISDFSFTTLPDAAWRNWTCRLELVGSAAALASARPRLMDAEGQIVLGTLKTDSMSDILNAPRYQSMVQGFEQHRLVESLCRKCTYRTRFDH